jgi:hypothetical protein
MKELYFGKTYEEKDVSAISSVAARIPEIRSVRVIMTTTNDYCAWSD